MWNQPLARALIDASFPGIWIWRTTCFMRLAFSTASSPYRRTHAFLVSALSQFTDRTRWSDFPLLLHCSLHPFSR
jgi:hypothetical protein